MTLSDDLILPCVHALHQVARQQEIGNSLLHGILVAAVPANQLALGNRSLKKKMVQILELLVIRLKLLGGWWLVWQWGEAKL